MNSNQTIQYLKVLWIFVFGMILVLYGVYMLIAFGAVGLYTMGSSFWVMLIGLLLTGVGSIYGKKKLLDPNTFKAKAGGGLGSFIQSTPQVVAQQPVKELQEAPSEIKANPMRPVLHDAEKRIEQDFKRVVSKGIRMASTVASKASTAAAQASTQDLQSTPAQEPVKVVKVLICPKCGSENQEADRFCFNCGKKLRMSGAKK